MIRQDYILREIERTIAFCIRLLGLKQDDEGWELEQFLKEHCEGLTGMAYETLVSTSSSDLVALLHHPGTASFARLVACGCVTCEAAEAARLGGDDDGARSLFMRGVEILTFTSGQDDPDVRGHIVEHLARLRTRVDQFEFPPAGLQRLAALFAAAEPK
ncbi:MAG: hypothetical protein HKO57_13590 [Akkermansiaceae bacterium]|nr:hypothetical protein [Akkermansiaceae bacterium]